MWQYFVFYPDTMRREFQIVIIVFSAIALAAVMGLSAKPFYKLGASVDEQFTRLASDLGAKGVVAVVSGLVTGGMLTFLFDFLIRGGVTIIAVRVLLDVLVFSALAALFGAAFVKWIARDDGEEKIEADSRGYLLTASAFFDERVFVAASTLINVKVSSAAFKALWKYGDPAALERLKLIVDCGSIGIVKQSEDFDSADDYAKRESELASGRRLVPVFFACDAFTAPVGGTALDVFASPRGDVRGAFIKKPTSAVESDAKEIMSEPATDAGEPNGEIIIDK